MKNIVLLGSTGSIGTSTIKVAEDLPDRIRILGLAAGSNAEVLLEQTRKHRPEAISISDPAKATALQNALGTSVNIFSGPEGLLKLATLPAADIVVIAIVGTAGLQPALAAIRAGKDIAIASKEILVMAGEIVMREARDNDVNVLPVDSEHNAIFQCLEGNRSTLNGRWTLDVSAVRRIILTASGGPFRETPRKNFDSITPEQALKHPTWNMGPKITIDSATLFNKGLEMIEARWLFGVEMKQVVVVIHPQSIVHSMVEFADGSTLAQLSHSNMRFPIQYAVTWPDRVPNSLPPLDFSKLSKLEFFAPRYDDFPALNLARRAGETGGTLPAVMNAANEIAVTAFLDRQVRFPDIWQIVEEVMNRHKPVAHAHLDAILEADQWARAQARKCVEALNG